MTDQERQYVIFWQRAAARSAELAGLARNAGLTATARTLQNMADADYAVARRYYQRFAK